MADKQFEIAAIQRLFMEVFPNLFVEGVALGSLIAGEDIENNLLRVRRADSWWINHVPAVNVKATITQAAGAADVRNVCTSVSVRLAAGSTAPTAVNLTVDLRDGASGAGTILQGWTISLPAVAGENAPPIELSNLWIEGSTATAMTLEFTAAGGTNTFESVAMAGMTIFAP